MAYSSAQLGVARPAFRTARRFGASRKEMLALAEAGLVETNFTHMAGGDRDSTGYLQQRPSQGWGPIGESVHRDTLQFLRAARKLTAGGFHGSAGQLAQAVQRSAFPGRYDARKGDARSLLASVGVGAGGRALVDASGALNVPGVLGAQNQPQGSEGLLPLLRALSDQQKQPVGGSSLSAPAFAAAPTLAGQSPMSGGGPAPKPDVAALLEAVRTTGGDVQLAPGNAGGMIGGINGARSAGPSAGGGRLGKVVVAPGANRAGVPLQPGPVKFARRIAGILGQPVTIGTGTAHSQFSVSGHESDHWRGEGMDIPASGAQLVRLGQAALIAAGMPAAQARKQKGGAYRVGGKQIIFSSNLPGYGDHTDHLHVGLSRRRG